MKIWRLLHTHTQLFWGQGGGDAKFSFDIKKMSAESGLFFVCDYTHRDYNLDTLVPGCIYRIVLLFYAPNESYVNHHMQTPVVLEFRYIGGMDVRPRMREYRHHHHHLLFMNKENDSVLHLVTGEKSYLSFGPTIPSEAVHCAIFYPYVTPEEVDVFLIILIKHLDHTFETISNVWQTQNKSLHYTWKEMINRAEAEYHVREKTTG